MAIVWRNAINLHVDDEALRPRSPRTVDGLQPHNGVVATRLQRLKKCTSARDYKARFPELVAWDPVELDHLPRSRRPGGDNRRRANERRALPDSSIPRDLELDRLRPTFVGLLHGDQELSTAYLPEVTHVGVSRLDVRWQVLV